MAGSYLETYGAAEQQRAKRAAILKWCVIGVVAGALLGYILYSSFENYGEEQQAKAFVERLKAQDYQAAYRMWGCTEATPCRDYSFQKFLEDWGQGSPHANAATAEIGSSDTCGTGVVIPLEFKGTEPVPLWVERSTKTIGFSPDQECRKKRWHFREFFRNLFNKQSSS